MDQVRFRDPLVIAGFILLISSRSFFLFLSLSALSLSLSHSLFLSLLARLTTFFDFVTAGDLYACGAQ